MRIAYLECFSGISGDMFLGALLDAGVPFELFQKTVAGLNIGAELEHSRVRRGGIAATKFDVVVNGRKDMPREEFWAQQHAYLECFSGISGDMFLGALLDAGVPFELFQKTVAGLNIGAELEHSRVRRGGIAAN